MSPGMLSFSRQFIHGCSYLSPTVLIEADIRVWSRGRHFLRSYKSTTIPRENPAIMKLNTPEFESLFTPELRTLESIFKKYGYEIRIAGGAVRDLLMGKNPKDLDFATVATPDQMREMFSKEEVRMINQKGESHGTITPRVNDKENFEVTTLRIDVVTDGRHAKVEFTEDWQLDANRRDLTINSMFLGFDGTVYDYFNGYEDLLKRKVIFVGNPEDRIKEDYLRILRYFRFFGRISSDPNGYDIETLEVIKANASGLKGISGERIWSELRLILTGNHGPLIFEKMLSIGMAPYIGFPQEPNMKELRSLIERTKDVKLHPVTYLAAVINNMTEALALNARLKMSTYERELVYFIVEHRREKLCPKPLLPFQKLMLHTKFKVADVHAWCVEVLLYNGQFDLAEELKSWEMPKFPVKGNDMKDHVAHSKQISFVVRKLKDYWAENDYKSSTEELIALIPKVLEEEIVFKKK